MTYLTYYKKPTLLEEVFDSFLYVPQQVRSSQPVHISNNDQSVVVQFECPGVQKDEIKISYQDDILTIETNKPTYDSDNKTVMNTIQYGTVTTSYRIPDISIDKSSSTLENGVLTITLPKQSTRQPHVISID